MGSGLALSGAPRQTPFLSLMRHLPPTGGSLSSKGEPKASPFGSNNDDHRQWRKQGVVVGAAASKTQVLFKARSECWVPQPGQWHCVSNDGEGKPPIIYSYLMVTLRAWACRPSRSAKSAMRGAAFSSASRV